MSIEKINEILEKAPENRPSYYQMKHFVLGNQPTVQAQMWQALRELQDKKDSMENLSFEIENLKDKFSLVEIDLEELKLDDEDEPLKPINARAILQSKRRSIKINALKRQQESIMNDINRLQKKFEFIEQEARFYIQAFESLSKNESLKDFDDLEAQKEYWEAKISEEINLRIMCRQNLSPDLLKSSLALHDGSKVKEEMYKLLNSFEKVKLSEKDDKKVIECRQ